MTHFLVVPSGDLLRYFSSLSVFEKIVGHYQLVIPAVFQKAPTSSVFGTMSEFSHVFITVGFRTDNCIKFSNNEIISSFWNGVFEALELAEKFLWVGSLLNA